MRNTDLKLVLDLSLNQPANKLNGTPHQLEGWEADKGPIPRAVEKAIHHLVGDRRNQQAKGGTHGPQ